VWRGQSETKRVVGPVSVPSKSGTSDYVGGDCKLQ
jgi:hypothetical protein